MAKHIRWDEVPLEQLTPLFERQVISTDRITIARIVLRKGMVVPRHDHEAEQITYVESGALKFDLDDGREIVVGAGEVLTIPSHLAHSAVALEDCRVIDTFSPPRYDWMAGNDAYLRGK